MLHKIVDQHGHVYKGEVLRGKRHGRGTIVYADTRDVYQGDFENDVPHGAGRYFVAGAENGLFEGLWKDGELYQVKKGRACIEDSNGEHYDGGFDHWKRHGRGTLKSANGDRYEGYFKHGLKHGQGTLLYSDGTKFDGLFKEGEPVIGSGFDDFDDKTIATTASEFETMGLNPYQTKGTLPHVKERESIPPIDETRDPEVKKRHPEEKRTKARINTEEDEPQQKQPKKVKKDVKRKLELLEKAKAEGKGQFQRDRRKYLLDAKKDLEKKRLKGGGETGPVKKTGQTEKISREKPDDAVKINGKPSKSKKGLFKKFHKERGKSRESIPEYRQKVTNDVSSDGSSGLSKEPQKKDNVRLDEALDRSSSADVAGHSKQGYSSSRPPAHPLSSSNDSWSPPLSPRGVKNRRIIPLDNRKSSKTRPQSGKSDRGRSRKTKQGRSQSASRGRSSSGSKSDERSSSSHTPFSFFRHRSKSTPTPYKPRERASTPGNMSKSSRMSNNSAYSQQSHTLEMLGSSSDSDSKFFTG